MEMIQTAVLIRRYRCRRRVPCEADPRTTYKRDRGACSLLVPPPARALLVPPSPVSVRPSPTPSRQLRSDTLDVLGRSNREVRRLEEFTLNPGQLYVEWAINDNLTSGPTHRRIPAQRQMRAPVMVVVDVRSQYALQ